MSRGAVARGLRVANIIICISALAYFASFLGLPAHGPPLAQIPWDLLRQTLAFPQVWPLLLILIVEASSAGHPLRHALLLLLCVGLTGFGYFFTHLVFGAVESRL